MLSTAWNTQRGSQSYIEKRRGRKEIEITRRRGEIRRGESNLASNQFPICVHSLEHSERFTDLHREEKMEEGDRVDLEEKRESQRGETNQASNQIPK